MKLSKRRLICGRIPEELTRRFMGYARELIPGIELGSLRTDGFRNVVDTSNYPLQVKKVIETFLLEWAEREKKTNHVWACAMTTIPKRFKLCRSTLSSLKSSGFDNIVVSFDCAEKDLEATPWNYYKNEVSYTTRGHNAKAYSHWLLTLTELFLRNSDADRFVIFQDDFVCARNLRAYLDRCPYPANGYLNLFTFMGNEQQRLRHPETKERYLVKVEKSNGWNLSNQKGQGGLALVFDSDVVVQLLGSVHMYARRWNVQRRDKLLDGAVVSALNKAGISEYVHYPSLIQHTGIESTLSERTWGLDPVEHPMSLSFPGEDFDCLSMFEGGYDGRPHPASP